MEGDLDLIGRGRDGCRGYRSRRTRGGRQRFIQIILILIHRGWFLRIIQILIPPPNRSILLESLLSLKIRLDGSEQRLVWKLTKQPSWNQSSHPKQLIILSSSSIGSYVSPFTHLQNEPEKFLVYLFLSFLGRGSGFRVHRVEFAVEDEEEEEEALVVVVVVGQSHRNKRRWKSSTRSCSA